MNIQKRALDRLSETSEEIEQAIAMECYHLRECREGRPIEPEVRCSTCPAGGSITDEQILKRAAEEGVDVEGNAERFRSLLRESAHLATTQCEKPLADERGHVSCDFRKALDEVHQMAVYALEEDIDEQESMLRCIAALTNKVLDGKTFQRYRPVVSAPIDQLPRTREPGGPEGIAPILPTPKGKGQ